MEEVIIDFTEETPVESAKSKKVMVDKPKSTQSNTEKVLINCLKNKKVIVKLVPKTTGLITDPKHVLYGGIGPNSKRTFVVPLTQSGIFVNVLTNDEKDFLESYMGLPDNSLSVYLKNDNYWVNKGVTLGKEPTILDLSVPDDYIKYKILLANKTYIADSEETLKNRPKASFQYVLVDENKAIESSLEGLTNTSKAYIIFGEIKDDIDKLSLIAELITGRTTSITDKNALYIHIDKIIRENAAKFIETSEDNYLDIKILIRKSVEAGLIRKRGHYYYLVDGNKPLCTEKQEPTLQSACEYLNAPKNQEIKFILEAKLNN